MKTILVAVALALCSSTVALSAAPKNPVFYPVGGVKCLALKSPQGDRTQICTQVFQNSEDSCYYIATVERRENLWHATGLAPLLNTSSNCPL